MDEQKTCFVYEFGGFHADELKRQLLRDGVPLPLTSKAFDTLLTLLRHRGDTISKDDLMNSIWSDTAVEENNLTQQISTLRRVLGERAGEHRFIVTIPGRGYSFVAAVHEMVVERSVELLLYESSQSSISIDLEGWRSLPNGLLAALDKSRMIGYSWALAFTLAVCLPVLLSGLRNSASGNHPQSLAVLKFRSGGSGDEFIGTGISDTLRARLGSVQDLIVRPGPIDAKVEDVVAAGRELNVDAVLTGSVQRSSERIRVTVEMVDVGNGRIVWGKTFDDSSSNLFELQDSIVGEVARFLRVRLTSRDFDRIRPVPASFAGSRNYILTNINEFSFHS